MDLEIRDTDFEMDEGADLHKLGLRVLVRDDLDSEGGTFAVILGIVPGSVAAGDALFTPLRSFPPPFLFVLVHSGRSRYRPWGVPPRRCDLRSRPLGGERRRSK